MVITLGTVTLETEWTTFRERIEEIGGRDAREIVVTGLVTELESVDAIEARLDAIVDAASQTDYSAELAVRPGRVLFVRRKAYAREVQREELLGAFALTLEARDPYEWSAAETVVAWTIDADPHALAVSTPGTVEALPVIDLVPQADVSAPAVGDGTRTLTYSGVIAAGQTLIFDSERSRAFLDGEDVTPYTTGEFPRIDPGGTTLTFTDGSASAPAVDAEVRFRDRWW